MLAHLLGHLELLDHGTPETWAPAGPADPHAQIVELVAATVDHVAIEAHQPAHLVGGALPVLGGERIGRQVRDTQLDRAVDDIQQRRLAAGMTLGALESTLLGPAAIAVHDDRDVPRQRLGGDLRRRGAAGMRGGSTSWMRHGLQATLRPGGARLDCSRAHLSRSCRRAAHQLGEADRIITLLTRENGKIRAVAKGVRRATSKFGSRVEPFSHIDVQLATGRGSLEVIAQVESLHSSRLGEDYRAFTAAEVLVETADRLVVEEHTPALQQYQFAAGGAAGAAVASSGGLAGGELVSGARALAIAGYAVSTGECAGCGSYDVRWFSPQGGGGVCPNCRTAGSARWARLSGNISERCWRGTGRWRYRPSQAWPPASMAWWWLTPPGTSTEPCAPCRTSSGNPSRSSRCGAQRTSRSV